VKYFPRQKQKPLKLFKGFYLMGRILSQLLGAPSRASGRDPGSPLRAAALAAPPFKS